jgi:hypothetical protein
MIEYHLEPTEVLIVGSMIAAAVMGLVLIFLVDLMD